MKDEEYWRSVEEGRKTLTPELMQRLELEMSMPSAFYEKSDAEREALWQRYLALRQQIGPEAAALAIRFEL